MITTCPLTPAVFNGPPPPVPANGVYHVVIKNEGVLKPDEHPEVPAGALYGNVAIEPGTPPTTPPPPPPTVLVPVAPPAPPPPTPPFPPPFTPTPPANVDRGVIPKPPPPEPPITPVAIEPEPAPVPPSTLTDVLVLLFPPPLLELV